MARAKLARPGWPWAVALLAWAAPAAAEPPPAPASPYAVDWTIDLSVLGAAVAIWTLPAAAQRGTAVSSCPCRSGDVPGIDRVALHQHSTAAARASDVAVLSVALLPAGLAALGVGLLRVLAGRHFPTDVLAGAAAGAAIGLTVPRLHRRAAAFVAPVRGGAAVVLSGAF